MKQAQRVLDSRVELFRRDALMHKADPRGFGLADLTLGERAMVDIPVPTTKDARVVVGVTRLPGGVLWLDFRVSARCPKRASSRVVVSSWATASSFNPIPAEIRNVRRMRRPM